jgi:serine/threonine-protein kinase
MKCLEKDPKQRPPSAAAVAAALPGGDLLAAAIAAGETPSPQMIAASREDLQGFRPATAWLCLGALLLGGALLVGLAPRTRVVSAAPLADPPAVMAARARDLIARFAPGSPVLDRAYGFQYEERYVDWIATSDSSRNRWNRLAAPRPPVVTYWYRQSPRELVSTAREPHIDYDDPPRLVPGMTGVQLDGLGRLRRLDALPDPRAALPDSASGWAAMFGAAGLDMAAFRPVPPGLPPVTIADSFAAWEGTPAEAQGVPVRVEVASYRGRPVSFAVREPWTRLDGEAAEGRDPSGRLTATMIGFVRPLLYVIALTVGAWIARRNLRAGRGDRRGATRVATCLMAVRMLIWIIGAHHTLAGTAGQLLLVSALALYDFAFGWVFYIAVEPYFRRLWPRVLITWMRVLEDRADDPQVGRDLLLGCVMGVVLSLFVAAHQAAPALVGAPPGRPDNVGFVEHQLAALSGVLQQVAALLTVQRSALILAMEFVVMLVMARLILRKATLSIAVTFLLFIPFALPKGSWPLFNVAFAAASLGLLFFVMLRFGLLPAIVGLLVNSTLQSTPLKWDPASWSHNATLTPLLLVAAVGVYGFVRSLAGRSAIRDVLPEST